MTAVYVVKPVAEGDRAQQDRKPHHDAARAPPRLYEQRGSIPDRRKMCRRVGKQVVLIERRSGVDRRKVVQRDGDVRTHIDEQA